jgi:hypothetical protein
LPNFALEGDFPEDVELIPTQHMQIVHPGLLTRS